ncbi:DUF3489 domain-containing protein [Mesorhizobium sp. M1143]|uniref:DUF3489 domain-containing protein n=1 Tax=Mesorhizobium sp. M1143 TaxID=2957061 RepID=UPI003334DA6F
MAILGTNQSNETDHDKLQIPPTPHEHIWDALANPPKQAKKAKSTKKQTRDTGSTAEPAPTMPSKPAPRNVTKPNKSDQVLKKLCLAKGATIEMLMEATGWQAHSVRGFLSAIVKKKLGLNLVSDVGKDGVRRYRIDNSAKGA